MNELQALELLGGILGPLQDPAACADLRQRLSDRAFDWPFMVRLASRHLVTPAAYVHMRRKNLLVDLDDELLAYFAQIAELNEVRNQRVREQVLAVIEVLNRRGVRPILLKGVAHQFLNLYCDRAVRMIGDIDLLVPAEHYAEALEALVADGYAPLDGVSFDQYQDHHHGPPLGRSDAVASVELHHETVNRYCRQTLPGADVIARSQTIEFGRQHAALPCAEDLVVHNIVHSQHVNRQYWTAEVLLRDAYDLIALIVRFGPELDWQRVVERCARGGSRGAVGFYVGRAGALLRHPVPSLPLTGGARLADWRWSLQAHRGFGWLRAGSRLFAYAGPTLKPLLRDAAERRRLMRHLSNRDWYRRMLFEIVLGRDGRG